MLRIAFFGTPEFAVPTLEALVASSHRVAAVVTQPDRPKGRGQRLVAPPARTVAEAHGLPVLQPERLGTPEFLDVMRASGADIGVVAAYGRILPESLLTVPRLGMVNVHASLLPRWRGASPVEHAVMAGDVETGVTIMRVVKALDAGAMLAAVRRRIGPDDTSVDVEDDLARMGARLLVQTLEAIEAGTAVETPQDERGVTYAPRLTKQHGILDWSLPAGVLHNRVRGLQPWPLAHGWLAGVRVALLRSSTVAPSAAVAATPGAIIDVQADRIVVAAGGGTALALLALQPEGRRAMTAKEFLQGRRIAVGTRFDSTPPA
jgi:methionyl-tRNA formyltransferase